MTKPDLMLSCIQTSSVAFFNRPKSLVVCCKCTEYIYCHRYTRIFWSMVYHKRYCGPNKDRRVGASAALPYLNQRWFCCDDHADCILSHSACYSALSSLGIMFSPFSFSFFPKEEGKKRSTHHGNHSVTSFFINIMENETLFLLSSLQHSSEGECSSQAGQKLLGGFLS